VLEHGERFGPFMIDGPLGEGGMSTVYRATPSVGGDAVALKVAKPAVLASATDTKRFLREARATQAVRHEHLVEVFDCGEVDGRIYIAMTLMTGGSLAEQIREHGPRPLEEVLRVVREIGGALDAMHGAGIVHRDLKPANILRDAEGVTMLADLGIARYDGFSVLTQADHVLGTMDYMAPEQIRGDDIGPATDIYALGCVVFEMLTGHTPFHGRGMFEVAFGHLDETPPDPSADRSDVSADIGEAALFALAKDPAERPPTASTYSRLLSVAAHGTVGT
jgi:eukaryotic-like serine/threonine-protein kinase